MGGGESDGDAGASGVAYAGLVGAVYGAGNSRTGKAYAGAWPEL